MTNTKEELLLHIKRLEMLLDSLPFDVWMKDREGRYLYANKSISDDTGIPKDEIVGKSAIDLYEKVEADSIIANDKAILEGQESGFFISRQDQEVFEDYKRIVYDESGSLMGLVGCSRNITQEDRLRDEFVRSEEQFRTIFEEAPLGIGIFDSITGKAVQLNERFAEIVGRRKDEVLSMDWADYSHPDEVEENRYRVSLLLEDKISGFSMEKRYVRPNGEEVWVNMTVNPFRSSHFLPTLHMCMIEDISARKKAEDEILYLSYYDQLTGLYNRRFYEEELKRINTTRNLPITLVLADVNGLKLTNDAFGHSLGDNLLKKISQIFKKECRSEDMIARIGGDEFVFLLPKTDGAEAKKIIERIKAAISDKKKEHLVCSVSFGWATKHHQKEDIRKIFMQAEDYMYRNKLSESTSMRNETIKLITKTLYQKNKREQLHCERVAKLCELIGNAMKMSTDSVRELKMAGLLHDIGKIGIDEGLLTKRGKFTESEWADMKRHPEIGYHILRSVNEFAPIADYVLHHHERVDGTGYPRQLKNSDIPAQSKIISIADAYDAMTSHRPYRDDRSLSEVIAELKRSAGTQFDAEILKVFIEQILKQRVWRRMD
ncbi:diguanylate cyclase [Anoxybacterium hadale]|uniref:Diguanylate cyclase n=1 Tax=Anoxybacterium hadale TaxID=3408580 RepID=A0ACD1A6W3_9FIRM|nr:diguanylate cyclase [Clostridiales bacterium]